MNKKDRLNELAIYAISFISMSSVAFYPALAMIGKSFPELSTIQTQMLVTVPSVGMTLSAFASPPLVKRFCLKSLYIINLFIVFVFSIMPFFLKDFTVIVAIRTIAGFSFSFIQILLTVNITSWFPVSKQGRLMGGRTAATSAGSIIMSYLGGVLADIDWHYTFLLFIMVAPVIVTTWLWLKTMPPQEAIIGRTPSSAGVQTATKKKVLFDGITIFICASSVIFLMFLQSYNTNIALLIDAENFGSATDSGVSVAIFNASGIVCGLLMAVIRRKLKGRTLLITILIGMCGMLIIGIAPNIYLIHIGSFLAGFSFMAFLGFVRLDITATIVTEATRQRAISLLAMTISFSGFLPPYVVVPVGNAINSGSVRTRFLVAGIMILIIAAAYEAIRRIKYRKHYSFYDEI